MKKNRILAIILLTIFALFTGVNDAYAIEGTKKCNYGTYVKKNISPIFTKFWTPDSDVKDSSGWEWKDNYSLTLELENNTAKNVLLDAFPDTKVYFKKEDSKYIIDITSFIISAGLSIGANKDGEIVLIAGGQEFDIVPEILKPILKPIGNFADYFTERASDFANVKVIFDYTEYNSELANYEECPEVLVVCATASAEAPYSLPMLPLGPSAFIIDAGIEGWNFFTNKKFADTLDATVTYTFYTSSFNHETMELASSDYEKLKLHLVKIGADFKKCSFYATSPDVDLNQCSQYDAMVSSLKKKRCGSTEYKQQLEKIKEICEDFEEVYDTNNICVKKCASLAKDTACSKAQDVRCGSIGTGLLSWLMRILKIIRYIVPVLVIILGIMDFIQAIAANDDDAMKKAGKKFVKRLIAAIIIFLLPLILQFLFDIFNIPGLESGNAFCTKK